MSKLGDTLRKCRTEARKSLQDVAHDASITKSHVWDMEKGHAKNPTIATILGLAFALEVNPLMLCSAALEDQPGVRSQAAKDKAA